MKYYLFDYEYLVASYMYVFCVKSVNMMEIDNWAKFISENLSNENIRYGLRSGREEFWRFQEGQKAWLFDFDTTSKIPVVSMSNESTFNKLNQYILSSCHFPIDDLVKIYNVLPAKFKQEHKIKYSNEENFEDIFEYYINSQKKKEMER